MFPEDLDHSRGVCPGCGHHFSLPPDRWAGLLCDPGSFEERDAHLEPLDPLRFADTKRYSERTRALAEGRGIPEAFVSGIGRLEGRPLALGVFDFRYLGGSMGSVVGEKVCRLFERAARTRCPAVVLSASGGARMQEGALSLMQMAKTAAVIGRFREERLPYVSVLLDPTTGGVAASLAMLGDVVLAEPRALIGFAGPRVIEQTLGEKLPEGFQRAEFLLEHGMIDAIVPRHELRGTLARLFGHLVGA